MITAAELFAMGMESPTAYLRMPELCEALGIEYPPKINGPQPPVSAEFHTGAKPWVSLHQTTVAATSSASLKVSTSDAATA